MKYEIKKRYTGEVIFTAEIDCKEDALPSIKLGLAIKVAVSVKADLSGADLSGADLYGANLSGAYLSGANLYGDKLVGKNPISIIGLSVHQNATAIS